MSSPLNTDEVQGKRTPTVLIVDDEAVITETLSLILKAHGYPTRIARTGEEAVEQARTSAPEVLVCDIILPGITGIDAAVQIRALCRDCRIILISGAVLSAELLERARADGNHFEVLAKPFHPSRLLELLRDDTPLADALS